MKLHLKCWSLVLNLQVACWVNCTYTYTRELQCPILYFKLENMESSSHLSSFRNVFHFSMTTLLATVVRIGAFRCYNHKQLDIIPGCVFV